MFEPIFSKKDVVDRRNNEVMNKIAAQEATCVDFPIVFREHYCLYGIWFEYEGYFSLVNPIELVNSIYEDNTYYYLLNAFKSRNDVVEGDFEVVVNKWDHCYSWIIMHTNSKQMKQMQFTYDDYIGKIKKCIDDLYEAWSAGKITAYKKLDVDLDGVEMCKKQLTVSGVTPSHYQLTTKDLIPEVFIFQPLKDEWTEQYEIGIGERSYNTWLTHWDNNMERIRHQLENYTYERKASIELNFDTCETILKFNHRSILDKVDDSGDGYAYKYKEYLLVELIPNDFIHMPIIKGYCEEKEAIRTFYECLLYMASLHPIDGKEAPEDDMPSKLVAYNRYKSPIIESFLKGEKNKPNTYETRQVHIDEILMINPDVSSYIWDIEDEGGTVSCYDDKDGNPIEMVELDKWAYEIEAIVIASETGEPYEKDWVDYHRRGLALAHKLREKLPASTDLWYGVPYEDKSNTIKHPILII